MAGIKELGESLLQRQKDRSDKQYERSRKEAYKIALATAGVGLANNIVESKARDFMVSEPVIAQKAKYRSLVNQSANIVAIDDEIQKQGTTAENYFFATKYLPQMEEEFKATIGDGKVPTSYLPQLREKARELARREAVAFNDALGIARNIPDYDTAMTQVNSMIMPPTNVGDMFTSKIRGIFTGKTSKDFRDEAVNRIEGLLKNDSYRAAFDRIAESDGIDEAVQYVKSLDAKGFTDKETVSVTTDIRANPEGQGFTVFETKQVVDSQGNPTSTNTTSRRIEGFETQKDKADVFKGIVDTADLPSFSVKALTPAAFGKFNAELRDEGYSLTSLLTVDDFKAVSNKLTEFMSINENLNDEFRNQAVIANITAGLEQTEFLIDALSLRRADSETEEEAITRTRDALGKIFNFSTLEQNYLRNATTPTERMGRVVNWDDYPDTPQN